VRDTGLEPTKSGVIGLIGCALGLGRGDTELERLDDALLFGVRIDRSGVISTDFHTVTGYHRTAAGEFKHSGGTAKSLAKAMEHGESTIVSPRDYLHDASFLVALAVKPECRADNPGLLERLRDHLEQPKWPLYLGRKSCVPSRPIFDALTDEYECVAEAFCDARHGIESRSPRKEQSAILTAWIEDSNGDSERQDAMRLNQLRFYDFRRCTRLEIDTGCDPWRVV
jgi:CRISPR system Cascade subunit CasD